MGMGLIDERSKGSWEVVGVMYDQAAILLPRRSSLPPLLQHYTNDHQPIMAVIMMNSISKPTTLRCTLYVYIL